MGKKIKNSIILLISLILSSAISFYIGYRYKLSEEDTVTIVMGTEESSSLRGDFFSGLDMSLIIQNETKDITNYEQYFDTLSSKLKDYIWCYQISNKDYLCLFRHPLARVYDTGVCGFSKDKFYLFERKEVVIKNNYMAEDTVTWGRRQTW